jgi:hypothetical protein
LVIVAVLAVAFAVIAAIAIGAVFTAAATLGLLCLGVGDAGGDGEEANGGCGEAGLQVHDGPLIWKKPGATGVRLTPLAVRLAQLV